MDVEGTPSIRASVRELLDGLPDHERDVLLEKLYRWTRTPADRGRLLIDTLGPFFVTFLLRLRPTAIVLGFALRALPPSLLLPVHTASSFGFRPLYTKLSLAASFTNTSTCYLTTFARTSSL